MNMNVSSRRHQTRPASGRMGRNRGLIEGLEPRQLFSAGNIAVSPEVLLAPASATAGPGASYSNPAGYTPAQIAAAYGLNQVTFSTKSGSVAGDGSGQTIAIVDAYNDPKIASDLTAFDARYLPNSAPVSSFLSVVNQAGGSKLPAADAGWAGEIALDVEWAHAAAPGAEILLVEANGATLGDLLAGVNYARHAPGVSVVSMSWGTSEFLGETAYDGTFTTPAGHQGVTFVAASGDQGPFSGAEWPAVSPNVVSVGGTSLHLQDSGGDYRAETAWAGSTGGTSLLEPMPAYQAGLPAADTQLTVYSRFGFSTVTRRSAPDVSYDADPTTGFSVYDSVPYQGYSGWEIVGGTSAGAPQWAALVAVANQGRVLAGEATLDGASQTLPALYGLYASPGTAGYATYTTDFHDVAGGAFFSPATSGYDQATGLGSPRAPQTVSILISGGAAGSSTKPVATSASTSATTTGTRSSAGTRTRPAAEERFTLPEAGTAAASTGSGGTASSGETDPLFASSAAGVVGDAATVAGPLVASDRFVVLAGFGGLLSGRAGVSLPTAVHAADWTRAVGGSSAGVIESGSGFTDAARAAALTPQALVSIVESGLSARARSAQADGAAQSIRDAKSAQAAVDCRLDLADMLGHLSPTSREILLLREIHCLSYQEIAKALRVPRGTVESRLFRARRQMRQRFDAYLE